MLRHRATPILVPLVWAVPLPGVCRVLRSTPALVSVLLWARVRSRLPQCQLSAAASFAHRRGVLLRGEGDPGSATLTCFFQVNFKVIAGIMAENKQALIGVSQMQK